jgi:DNA-binding response OmpR family regulator
LTKSMLIIVEDNQVSHTMEHFFSTFFTVEPAVDGFYALIRAVQSNPDVIYIGYQQTKISSLELCKQIRQYTQSLVLVVGDRMDEQERIACYDAGADEVFLNSVSLKEQLCKINGWLQRLAEAAKVQPSFSSELNHFGLLTMNKLSHKSFVNGEELMLTRKEFSILWMLIVKPNQIISRNEILRIVWSYDYLGDDRMIDTHLNRIRKKLQKYNHDFVIKTVWGIGYKIEQNNGRRTNVT